MKLIIFLGCILFCFTKTYAQITEGGRPLGEYLAGDIPVKKLPWFNLDSVQAHRANLMDGLDYFGYAISVEIDLKKEGLLQILENGDKLWRLKIQSSGAKSLNFIYDQFFLPEGARFFVYAEDFQTVLGAFTGRFSNLSHGRFATDVIAGHTSILEYLEPQTSQNGQVRISKAIHGYSDIILGGGSYQEFGQSADCHLNVLCDEGFPLCLERQAVSLLLTEDNSAFCSGCLLNNAREDHTPYFLTAFHCFDSNGDGTLSSRELDKILTSIFRFGYYSPTCNPTQGPNSWVSILGAELRAGFAGTDFALLELAAPAISGLGITYAGWHRDFHLPTLTRSIHHPRGDVMKVSVDLQPPSLSTWNTQDDNWLVVFDQGAVQPTSSGAPLFNQHNQVIGQLQGNRQNRCTRFDNKCFCEQTRRAEYPRLDLSWDGGGTPQTRLRDWLDPDNTGVISIGPTAPKSYLLNRILYGYQNFTAIGDLHVEGEVITSGFICRPSGLPFIAEVNSEVELVAQTIRLDKGVHLKQGSTVEIRPLTNFSCSQTLFSGDYSALLCNAQVSARLAVDSGQGAPQQVVDLYEALVYPNPTTGTVRVVLPFVLEAEKVKVSWFNALGQELQQMSLVTSGTDLNLDLSYLASGTYYCRISFQDKVVTAKVIMLKST